MISLDPQRLAMACLGFAACLLAASPPATALTSPIDDTGTVVLSPTVLMRWNAFSPAHGNNALMSGSTAVRVRLNVAQWLNRSGRIFLELPAQQPGPVRASWVSQGRLMPGTVNSGDRALIYAGRFDAPFLEDVLQLSILVDGRNLQSLRALDFRFELETP